MLERDGGLPINNEDEKLTTGTTKFSPETKIALKKLEYPIYELHGKTIAQLRQEGAPITRQWDDSRTVAEVESLQSRKSEVALGSLALPGSFNKSVPEQMAMIQAASDELQRNVPGASMVVGSPADYAELAWEMFQKTGKRLFQYEVGIPLVSRFIKKKIKEHWFTRTDTHFQSFPGFFYFAITWSRLSNEIDISAWPRQHGNHIMGVTPIIVPVKRDLTQELRSIHRFESH